VSIEVSDSQGRLLFAFTSLSSELIAQCKKRAPELSHLVLGRVDTRQVSGKELRAFADMVLDLEISGAQDDVMAFDIITEQGEEYKNLTEITGFAIGGERVFLEVSSAGEFVVGVNLRPGELGELLYDRQIIRGCESLKIDGGEVKLIRRGSWAPKESCALGINVGLIDEDGTYMLSVS
jgi:hypothetical protein